MPGRSPHLESQHTFHCPSLPFYLKALFLTSVATAEQVILQNDFLGERVLDAASSDPVLSVDDTATENSVVIHLNETPVSDYSVLTFPEFLEAGEQQEGDEASNSFAQRHLLQVPLPTTTEHEPAVVTNPIPDQVIQIGEQYTYDVSKVFSGDHLRLQAADLPDWLRLEYKQLGSYRANTGFAQGVAVSGNTVFVANWVAGLVILNVSDLSRPQLLSTYPAGSGTATGVAVLNNTVFIANGYAGLLILNVSDLSRPRLLSTYSTGSGIAYAVAASGNTVFVVNGNAGLLILNVSDLSRPQLLSTYPAG